MSVVTSYLPTDTQSQPRYRYYICDTEPELPSVADHGDLAFTKSTNRLWKRAISGWAPTTLTQKQVIGARVTWLTAASVSIGTAGQSTEVADSTGIYAIEFLGTLTASLAASGAGGLDTGVEAANAWYALHLIDASNGTMPPAAMFSLSATAPTLPAGYDIFRRVCWVRNNGSSNIIRFVQTGQDRERRIEYDEERTNLSPLIAGNATAFTTISLASFIPPTVSLTELTLAYDSSAPSNQAEIRTTGSTVADPATFFRVGVAAPTGITGYFIINTNASQQIDYRVTVVTEALDIYTVAYYDEL